MHEHPNAWDQEYLGISLLHEEAKQLESVLPRLFGYHLAIIGDSLFSHYAKSSLIQHRILVTRQDAHADSCTLVRGQYNQLPISSESLDVVILPHTLETVKQPESVLRDAVRVLRPNGYLLITGANPFSWVGVRYELERNFNRGSAAYRWPSAKECQKWCAWLDVEIDRVDYFHSCMPFLKSTSTTKGRGVLDSISLQYGGYMILAIKREVGVTPIRASWNRRRTTIGTEVPIS